MRRHRAALDRRTRWTSRATGVDVSFHQAAAARRVARPDGAAAGARRLNEQCINELLKYRWSPAAASTTASTKGQFNLLSPLTRRRRPADGRRVTRWRLGLERRRARHHHREDGSRFSLLHYEYDDELAKEIVVGPSAHTARECPVNYRMMTAVNVTTAFMRHRLAHPSSRWSMLPVMVNIIIPHVNQHNRPELFLHTLIDGSVQTLQPNSSPQI